MSCSVSGPLPKSLRADSDSSCLVDVSQVKHNAPIYVPRRIAKLPVDLPRVMRPVDLLRLQAIEMRTSERILIATRGYSTWNDSRLCARFKKLGAKDVKIIRGGIAAVAREYASSLSATELVVLSTLTLTEAYQALYNSDVKLLVLGEMPAGGHLQGTPVAAKYFPDDDALHSWLTQALLDSKNQHRKFVILLPKSKGHLRGQFSHLNNVFYTLSTPIELFRFIQNMRNAVTIRNRVLERPCAIPSS